MSENQVYVAIGQEAARGTAESTTVGFIPVTNPAPPTFEPEDIRKGEYRGEETALGAIGFRRMSTKWSYPLETNLFSEAGTTAGIVGTSLRHAIGYGTSTQNGSTGQYYHMLYPVSDPYSVTGAGKVLNDALTINHHLSEGATTKNHAYFGGRVMSLALSQEPGQLLKANFNIVGQGKEASAAAIATPTYAAEDLRFDNRDLTCYTGTITRTGTGPDYTEFAFGSATSFIPDKVDINIEFGREDKSRLSGLIYPDKTVVGQPKVTLALTINFDDPASGFSSSDERNRFLAGIAYTNFFFHWDTGTQAGTGDNHSLYIDLPVCKGMPDNPELSMETEGMITLNYECDFDSTTTNYLIGMMLKNTAATI